MLCGLSAGSLCWFSESVTAFHGPPQRVAGLGLLPYSNCVHYSRPQASAYWVEGAGDGLSEVALTQARTLRRARPRA